MASTPHAVRTSHGHHTLATGAFTVGETVTSADSRAIYVLASPCST